MTTIQINSDVAIDDDLMSTFINVTLLAGCPPGLTLRGDSPGCDCYLVLSNNNFQCFIQNKTGYLSWNTTMWVNATFSRSQSNVSFLSTTILQVR